MKCNLKRKPSIGLICILVLLLLTGCQPGASEPDEVFKRSVSAITGEDHYSYSGYTTVSVNGTTMEKMFQFDGFVTDHKRVLMNLEMRPTGTDGQKVILYGTNNKVFLKQNDKWKPVGEGDNAYLAQHFQHWSPVDNLVELARMEKTVAFGTQAINNNENRATRVLTIQIDPEEMKRVVAQELEAQFEASIGSTEDLGELKKSLKLSDEEFAEIKLQVEQSVRQARMQLTRLIDSLQVSGQYEMIVEARSFMPRQLQMTVQSNYESENGPVSENTRVVYYFKDFGKKENDVPLPDL